MKVLECVCSVTDNLILQPTKVVGKKISYFLK